MFGDKLDARLKFAAAKRPDLACYDDRPLADADGAAKKLIVIEFKRPGVTIGADELLQVMQYKKVFATTLAGFPSSNIEVILLGDKFDPSFDFDAFGEGYSIMSYHQLLVDAHSRYGELYNRLTGGNAEGVDGE